MTYTVKIFSENQDDILRFLKLYFGNNICLKNNLCWEKEYDNPINMIELISTYADNSDKFKLGVWICLDENVLININDHTINSVIKYLIERYPSPI